MALRDYLGRLGLPLGLLPAVSRIYQECESRFWLIDNSSEMSSVMDGHVGKKGSGKKEGGIKRVDGVSRWEELRECVAFHTKVCIKMQRFLSGE